MKSLLEEKIQNGPLLSVFLFAKTQTHTTHTRSTPAVAEYLPASQLLQARSATALQFPVKPLFTTEPSDVKVTLRKPVVDV
jgi:hypothetical protein